MAQVRLNALVKRYGVVAGGARHRPRHRAWRVRGAGGPVGLRQVDDAAHDRRPRGDLGRHDPDRRPGRQRPAAAQPQHLHGVPELRALPAHDGAREPRLRAEDRGPRGRRHRRAGHGGFRHPGARRPARPPAGEPVRRPAPARRHGSRHRPQSGRLPLRRAPVQPRRQAARADAGRDQAPAPEGQDHGGLRHPRPGRGDDARRPHRHHARRPDRAGRHPARRVRAPGQHLRGRASSARRR